MGSFSDPKDLEGLAHFLGISIEFLVYSVLCRRICVLMDTFVRGEELLDTLRPQRTLVAFGYMFEQYPQQGPLLRSFFLCVMEHMEGLIIYWCL